MITHKIINRAITLKSHLKTVCLIVDIPQTSSGQVELCILAIGYIRTMERKKENFKVCYSWREEKLPTLFWKCSVYVQVEEYLSIVHASREARVQNALLEDASVNNPKCCPRLLSACQPQTSLRQVWQGYSAHMKDSTELEQAIASHAPKGLYRDWTTNNCKVVIDSKETCLAGALSQNTTEKQAK